MRRRWRHGACLFLARLTPRPGRERREINFRAHELCEKMNIYSNDAQLSSQQRAVKRRQVDDAWIQRKNGIFS